MKTISGASLILAVLLTLASCTTSTTYQFEPDSDEATLVVGQINLDFIGFPSDFQVNGAHGSGLKLTFKDEFGEKLTTTAYGRDALFGFEADHEFYQLVGIDFSNTRIKATIRMNWACTVVPGKVNNLGLVEGEWHYYGPSNNDVVLLPPGGHKNLESRFNERYPLSLWNDKEWVESAFYLK